MTSEQHRRVRELFDAALDQPLSLRGEFLASACQGDLALQAEVERLLRISEGSVGILDTPIRERFETESPDILPGSFIGSYRILKELSGGGMGIVYQAVRADEVFQRVCAIKVIRPELFGGRLGEQFRRERQILGRLDHVNIARIVDGGSTPEGLPYFVMDFVDGAPIHKFCADNSLSVRQRLALFQQACAAVQYIHRNGVIHGDLKPSNILVSHDGVVKLVDFGIATALSDSGDSGWNSVPALMTPCYASPEQFNNERLTPVSDVFSLGVILYELLTGGPPLAPAFRGREGAGAEEEDPIPPSAAAHAAERAANGAKAPSRIRRDDLDSIVLCATQRRADRRYPSVAALSDDVGRFLQSRAVSARKGGPIYRSRKFILRHRVAALVAPMFALLLASTAWEGIELRKRYDQSQFFENQMRVLQRRIEDDERALGAAQIALPSPSQAGKPADNAHLREVQLQNVRDLANAYHTNFAESVRLWPGMTRRRRELLDKTAAYLHKAEPYVGLDPTAPAELASAWMQLANIEGNPSVANLHDRTDATVSINQAERLLASSPTAPAPLVERVRSAENQIRTGKK